MTRVLIVGQASQKTGLARVTRAIAHHLSAYYDVHVLGIDCFDEGPSNNGWTLHRNPLSFDLYAETRLTTLMDELRPAAVLLYNDLWVIPRYFGPLKEARHRCPIVGYVPIDGEIAQTSLITALASLDLTVVFTKFAAAQLHDAYVIPHGVDTSDFYPMSRIEARKELFPDRPELWDGFWVLNANRNQLRKRLELTLRGFAQFAANKPANVRLYLHSGLNDIGVNLMYEAEKLGITDRLLFTHGGDHHPASSTKSLNAIYNACDVGVNTATGEGWGLISCEHAATRAAQIVPRHSACAEIWDGAAELMPVAAVDETHFFNGGIIDPADLADSLERLYADRTLYEARAQSAYERMQNPAYRWETIATQWRTLLDSRIS